MFIESVNHGRVHDNRASDRDSKLSNGILKLEGKFGKW